MTLPVMCAAFEAVLGWCRGKVERVVYKAVPAPYHRLPADEDLIALFLLNAQLTRRSALAVVELSTRLPFQERRRRAAKKALSAGISITESDELTEYWGLLSAVLLETHGAKPVHTLKEISALKAKFPTQMRLFEARSGAALVAGVLVYQSSRVARAQYIAANQDGKKLGALDLLFDSLLTETFANVSAFDFGTSELDGGRRIQQGLIEQKEGFGARVVAQDTYSLELDRWAPGALEAALS